MLNTNILYTYNNIIFTGGIGDFIVLDYFYDLSQYKNIYLVTAQANNIKVLIDSFKTYRYSTMTVCDCQKMLDKKCYGSLAEILTDINVPSDFKTNINNCDDFSIAIKFPEIKQHLDKKWLYKINQFKKVKFDSSILKNKIANITKFNLPKSYFFIAHNTVDTLINCIACHKLHKVECPVSKNRREFIDIDWENTIDLLVKLGYVGVVVGTIEIPEKYKSSSVLVDLIGQSSINEGFEILKNAYGYIGIDTCYSVIASKIFQPERILIKSVNINEYLWQNIYLYDIDSNENDIKLYENIPKDCEGI